MSLYKNPPDAVRYLENFDEYFVDGVRRPNHNVHQLYSFKTDTYCDDPEIKEDGYGPDENGYCTCTPSRGGMEFGPTPEHDEMFAEYWLKNELEGMNY